MFLVPTYLFVHSVSCFAPILQRGVTQVSKSPPLSAWLCQLCVLVRLRS